MHRSVHYNFLVLALTFIWPAEAQVTTEQLQTAKNAAELETLNATQHLIVEQKTAETRKATAEANRAEALAMIPPTTSTALTGKVDTAKFGAAGLVKAFDLANQLAKELCQTLPKKFMIYNAETSLAIISSKNLEMGLNEITAQLGQKRVEIAKELDPNAATGGSGLLAIPIITGAIKAVADLTSLAKTNTAYTSEAFGDMTRPLFITALANNCADKAVGLGGGYLGELNYVEYENFQKKAEALRESRETLAARQKALQAKLDKLSKSKQRNSTSTETTKAGWKAMLAESAALIKSADELLASLTNSATPGLNPLYRAAIYSSYAKRTEEASVLDFDLRLEGLTINKENLFTGQKITLSGVAFLWYRLHARDGSIITAKSIRAITEPEQIKLSGEKTAQQFWGFNPK